MSTIIQTAPVDDQSRVGSSSNSAPGHLKWLIDTGRRLKSADGKTIEIWELRHTQDDAVLSAWAKHFRNHYCADGDIDSLRGPRSRKQYLEEIKFPSQTGGFGPSIRAGDFGEILIADYLQWILGHAVPRLRWDSKVIRDESTKGSDVIGFWFQDENTHSPSDTLAVFEAKTKFSNSGVNRLQDAINDSAKDHLRIDESLNYIKQRLRSGGKKEEAERMGRFQNPVDEPYRELFGAVALYADDQFLDSELSAADIRQIPTTKPAGFRTHPKADALVLIVIKGPDMMALVHELYRRAADEA